MKSPQVWKDMVVSFLYTIAIIISWSIAYVFFGDEQRLSTSIVSFFGALIAIAALMVKQYSLKETLEYLATWKRVKNLIQDIMSNSLASDSSFAQQFEQFDFQKKASEKYLTYIKREIFIVSIAPVLMVFLYGIALICEKAMVIRGVCLCLMLNILVYLTRASITSNRIATEHPEQRKAIQELEEILGDLRKSET